MTVRVAIRPRLKRERVTNLSSTCESLDQGPLVLVDQIVFEPTIGEGDDHEQDVSVLTVALDAPEGDRSRSITLFVQANRVGVCAVIAHRNPASGSYEKTCPRPQ